MAGDRKKADRLLSEEEERLWNRISGSVKPLPGRKSDNDVEVDRLALRPPRFSGDTAARNKTAPRQSATPSRAGDHSFRSHRLDDVTARKLRKGRIRVDSRIDLHGMTQRRAHGVLVQFLESAHRRGDRIVLVITGKGRDSGGVLRRAVPLWLQERGLREIAGAWREASLEFGGEGALFVRLRRRQS